MPHVTIKCYPGRSEEQKKLLAQKIAADIVDCFGEGEGSISIDIHEVPQEQWNVDVWDKDIEPRMDELYKKPRYSRP
jgi:4-oxalocrotonate tautomerase